MSLRVWLPLLDGVSGYANHGTSSITVTHDTYEFGVQVVGEGILGGYSTTGNSATQHSLTDAAIRFTSEDFNDIFSSNSTVSFSVSFWIKGSQFTAGYNYTFFSIDNFASIVYTHQSSSASRTIRAGYEMPHSSSLDLLDEKWHHIAVTFKGNPWTVRVYVNGTLVDQATEVYAHASFSQSSSITVKLFNAPNGAVFDLGYCDFRIYDLALSSGEVKDLARGLIAHYPLDTANPVDVSGYARNGTETSSISLGQNNPIRYSKYKAFDETGAITVDPVYALGTNIDELSISFWIRKSPAESGVQYLFNAGGSNVRIYYWEPSTLFPFLFSTSSGTVIKSCTISRTNLDFYDNKWHHIVVVASILDPDNCVTLYVDNSVIRTAAQDSSLIGVDIGTPLPWIIGGHGSNSGIVSFLEGDLSDFRIYATGLTADDVKELYETSACVYKNGSICAYEFKESNANDITKNGVWNISGTIEEADGVAKICKAGTTKSVEFKEF